MWIKLAAVQELRYDQELLPKFALGQYAAEKGFAYFAALAGLGLIGDQHV
ncbi:hypothetical protein [Amycolatopsis sp. NPDC102389]